MFLPTDIPGAVQACVSACIIAITPGNYGRAVIQDLHPRVAVTVDLTGSTFTEFDFYRVSNFTISGGTFVNSQLASIVFVDSDHVGIVGVHCIAPGAACGSMGRVTNFTVTGNFVEHSGGDGFDVAGSQNGIVKNNVCAGNAPQNGLHPDCWQGWPLAGYPLTDITVSGNAVVGSSQGFDVFNNDASLTAVRLHIDNNTCAIDQVNCVGLLNVSNSDAIGNRAFTLPGAQWASRITIWGVGTGDISTGNVDGAAP